MGYRSDIRIAFKQDAFDEFDKKYKELAKAYYELNPENNKWAEKCFQEGVLEGNVHLEKAPHEGEVIYSLNYVKWNRHYKDVQWYYGALEHITEQGYGYIFVRIGEDGLIEEDANFDIDDPEFDAEEPIGRDNVEPIETVIYGQVQFVVE